MATLDIKDFKHFKDLSIKDIQVHREELTETNLPAEVIAGYNGKFFEQQGVLSQSGNQQGQAKMTEDYLFISANTVLPSLFFQLPRATIRARRTELDFQAAVLTALMEATFGEDEKEENQLCIIDAFLPYGFAVMKNGYNSRTGIAKRDKKPNIFTGKTSTENVNENDMEGDVEFIRFEKAISVRQSPAKTYLDSTQPFGKGNRITFEYERTLQEVIDSNLYTLSTNFLSFFGAKSSDKRDTKLKLFEMWLLIGGQAHKLVWVEGWAEELAWVKTKYDELPVSYLRFNKMGDILYSISHGTLAVNAQKELNYLNELWKNHIDNLRNQFIVWKEALMKGGEQTLINNKIGGIVFTDKPVSQGMVAAIQSQPMDSNLFNNITNVREYLKLILSTTGAVGGGPDSELATVERNKEIGNVLRTSGMQDEIRRFLKDQIRQRIKNILRLGDPKMTLKITGQNLTSPLTGQLVEEGTDIEIGGDEGFALKDIITGDVDVDFIFEIDIMSAAKPDFPVIRKQLAEGIALARETAAELQASGKQFDLGKAIEMYFDTFDAIPNAKALIKDVPQVTPQAAPGAVPGAEGVASSTGGVPTPEQIAKGAETVPTGAEGLTV